MKKYWYILTGLVLAFLMPYAISGCGLQWVPSGQTPPPGARPIADVALDALGRADAAGWGDLAQIIGGALGCGGIVAVGRKVLRNHRHRKALEVMNSRKDVALREIIAGVQEIIAVSRDDDAEAIKATLRDYQKSIDTEKLVSDIRIDIDAENRDPDTIN